MKCIIATAAQLACIRDDAEISIKPLQATGARLVVPQKGWQQLGKVRAWSITPVPTRGHSLSPLRVSRGPAGQGRSKAELEEDTVAVIYTLLPLLYGFLNSAPATINVVNVEIISIFWRQAVIYSSHFSGAGSHAVKSSDLPIKC